MISDVTVDDDFAETDNVLVKCIDTSTEVTLPAEFTLNKKEKLLFETVRTLDGQLVTEATFHLISQD